MTNPQANSQKKIPPSCSCSSILQQAIKKNNSIPPICVPKVNNNTHSALSYRAKSTSGNLSENHSNLQTQNTSNTNFQNDHKNTNVNDNSTKSYIEQGDEYFDGKPPDYIVDFTEAAKFYKLAADAGDIQGLIKYGNMLRYGFGVEINKKEAKKYYEIAKNKGDPVGKKLFDIMVYQEANFPEIPLDNSNPNPNKTENTQTNLNPIKAPGSGPDAKSPRNKK